LNDGQIPNRSNPFKIVPLSNFVPRGFGFVHPSIAILYHEVPNPNLTIRNFSIAVFQVDRGAERIKGTRVPGMARVMQDMTNTSRKMLREMNGPLAWPFRGAAPQPGRTLHQLMYTPAESRIAAQMYAHQVRDTPRTKPLRRPPCSAAACRFDVGAGA
jgi:hypothetical protein